MDDLLIALFGTSKLAELALPMMIVLVVITGAIFWVVSFFSRRRQKHLIAIYNGKLNNYSKHLRQNNASSRKQN